MDTCNKLPKGMLAEHGDITLAIDIMYINKIPFIMMTSWTIHFGTAELIKYEKILRIMIALRQVIKAYQARGFKYFTFSEMDNLNTLVNTLKRWVLY